MKPRRVTGSLTTFRRLLSDRRGGVAAIFGLAVIPMFAAIGLAVDVGRGFMLKSKLSYAIDSAGLAGGRAFDQDTREEDIMMFFRANFPEHYMESELAEGHPVITIDDDANTITIEAQATLPTRFMRIAGYDEMTVGSRTVIQRELRGMELVLVMDNTGSMRSGGRMDAMKDAAQDLVDILYGDREEVPQFWVGLVPYSATVNIGSDHVDWLIQQAYDPDAAWQKEDPDNDTQFGYHADHYRPTTWKGCVEARPFPNDSNDATPAVEGWYPHLWRTTLERFENPEWDPPGDLNCDGDVDQDDYDLYFDITDLETWGHTSRATTSGIRMVRWRICARTTTPRTAGPDRTWAAARPSRRWSRRSRQSSRRSTRCSRGIAAAPSPTSASPGAGACSRPAGGASGAATARPSCRSPMTSRTWRKWSSC
jgi:Flp pilus assembly protein TadG